MITVYIYCLSDPLTNEIRYVGKTWNVMHRFGQHISDSKQSHKTNWIKSLKSAGLLPEIDVLEILHVETDSEWQSSEGWWISYLRSIGCRLTNTEIAPIGGGRRPLEVIERIRAKQKGRPLSAEHRAKLRGKKRTPEQNLRNSLHRKGKPLPEGMVRKGMRLTEEHIKNLQKGQRRRRSCAAQLEFFQRHEP